MMVLEGVEEMVVEVISYTVCLNDGGGGRRVDGTSNFITFY